MESPNNHKAVARISRVNVVLFQVCNNYERIGEPPTTLLKKDAFSWTPGATKAFEHLKEAMCLALVLAMRDFTKTFTVECDASRNGIGGVLMQEERPISFEIHIIKGKYLQKVI